MGLSENFQDCIQVVGSWPIRFLPARQTPVYVALEACKITIRAVGQFASLSDRIINIWNRPHGNLVTLPRVILFKQSLQ